MIARIVGWFKDTETKPVPESDPKCHAGNGGRRVLPTDCKTEFDKLNDKIDKVHNDQIGLLLEFKTLRTILEAIFK